MAEQRVQRRLAAILAADVVGYSRLMEQDEAGTMATLKARRTEILQPVVSKHHGRIVKLMGDGVLVEFASAVNAVECAVELQDAMAAAGANLPEDQQIRLRVGINLGDVLVEGTDLYGDGVNIAARLEALAEPGSVFVSRTVFNHVRGKVKIGFENVGEKQLKNIANSVQIYRLKPSDEEKAVRPGLALPDKPSIAVLPFQNMSGDPEQEYFADGMVDDIITALSRMRWLFVIARNSSFTYKGRAVDVKQVGRELGVRYILEGSVRKAGEKVRITGQLIDTSTGGHLWADRFDGGIADIFDLQDQITASVVAAIAPKLEQAEIERAKRKPTENLDAYDYYLRGLAGVHRWTPEANDEALKMLYRAIELDPEFASAYGMAARCYSQRKTAGWVTNRAKEVAEAARLARRAAELGRDDAVALCTAGLALAFVVGDLDSGATLTDRALALSPNLAWPLLFSGWVNVWIGEPEVAIQRFARAMRLNPQDPLFFQMQAGTASAHFFAGRYAEASTWAETAVRDQPNFLLAWCTAAASNALAGRTVEAGRAMARLRQLDPELRLSNLEDLLTLRQPEHIAKWGEGLRRAGLPE
jgi:TolB-like protein/Tfp pilus assembly protein PilF